MDQTSKSGGSSEEELDEAHKARGSYQLQLTSKIATCDLSISNLGDDTTEGTDEDGLGASFGRIEFDYSFRLLHPTIEENSEELQAQGSDSNRISMGGSSRRESSGHVTTSNQSLDHLIRPLGVPGSPYGSSTRRNSKKNEENDDSIEDEEESSLQKVRAFCGLIVNNSRFQIAIIVLIILNAALMGIATFDFVTEDPKIDDAFTLADRVFLIIFTIELVLQFVYHGLRLFTDPWLVFDFAIVVSSWSFESLQIVRSFRIFRAFRLISRLSLLRNLVEAIVQVLPQVAAISTLLLLIMYIYAVLCTELFEDLYATGATDHDYFSRLDYSFFTLFQLMTLDWSEVARQTLEVYPWSWTIFVSFILFSAFIVYNLIIAVVCDTVALVESRRGEAETEESEEVGLSTDDEDSPESQRLRIDAIRCRLCQMIKSQNQLLDTVQSAVPELERLDSSNECVSPIQLSPQSSSSSREDIRLTDSYDAHDFALDDFSLLEPKAQAAIQEIEHAGTLEASDRAEPFRQASSLSRAKRTKSRASGPRPPTSSDHVAKKRDLDFGGTVEHKTLVQKRRKSL
jgi:hypothetical protein